MGQAETTTDPLCLHSQTPEETRRLASCLARAWEPGGQGAVLQLQGELGAGKTVFVKGIAEEMGIDPRGVSSPTFVLANLYDIPKGGGSLHHVDFYRLEAFEELEDMGFFDLIVPEALLAVEWGDRFPSALPADRLELKLSSEPEAGSEMRTLLVRARGRSSRIWLERWRRNLDEEGVRVS